MYYMSDEKWKALSEDEQAAHVKAEMDAMLHWGGMVADGIAVRAHGLIYRLPLCHDFADIHI